MVCRTSYSTTFVFIAFDFDHFYFRHRYLKFQVPCIGLVFAGIVLKCGWLCGGFGVHLVMLLGVVFGD